MSQSSNHSGYKTLKQIAIHLRAQGQGMVEFALALPVFLVLMFGVIEAGHLLMMYSAVYSAAREGARYGAAIGRINPADINSPTYDHDCNGIRAAAVRVGFLGGVKTESVIIRMFGPDGMLKKRGNVSVGGDWCNNLDLLTELGDRVEVEVAVSYSPIVPLVPFPSLNVSVDGLTGGVRSISARTLVQNVALEGVVIPTATPSLFRLTINVDGNGMVVNLPVGDSFHEKNSTVELKSAAATCWTFSHWTIDGTDVNSDPKSITISKNIIVTAHFTPIKYTLTLDTTTYPLNVNVVGGEVSIDNGTFTTTNGHFSGQLNCGNHNLVAIPAPLYFFYNWSGAISGADSPINLSLNGNTSITASFTTPNQPRKLTVNLNIPNSGIITDTLPGFGVFPGSYNYLPEVTEVHLNATNNPNFGFINWTNQGNGNLGTNPAQLIVTMNANKTVNANFGSSLTITPIGCGTNQGCSVSSNPNQLFYAPGTNVTVSAIPGTGWSFEKWVPNTGTIPSSNANPYSFTFPATGIQGLNGIFYKTPYTLTISVNPVGSATTSPNSPAGPYYYDDNNITVTVSAREGYEFASWKLNGVVTPVNQGNNQIIIPSIQGNTSLLLNMNAICAPTSSVTVSLPAYSSSGSDANYNIANNSGWPIHVISIVVTGWTSANPNGSISNLRKINLNNGTMWSGTKSPGLPFTITTSSSNEVPAPSAVNMLNLSFDGKVSGVQATIHFSNDDFCGGVAP